MSSSSTTRPHPPLQPRLMASSIKWCSLMDLWSTSRRHHINSPIWSLPLHLRLMSIWWPQHLRPPGRQQLPLNRIINSTLSSLATNRTWLRASPRQRPTGTAPTTTWMVNNCIKCSSNHHSINIWSTRTQPPLLPCTNSTCNNSLLVRHSSTSKSSINSSRFLQMATILPPLWTVRYSKRAWCRTRTKTSTSSRSCNSRWWRISNSNSRRSRWLQVTAVWLLPITCCKTTTATTIEPLCLRDKASRWNLQLSKHDNGIACTSTCCTKT